MPSRQQLHARNGQHQRRQLPGRRVGRDAACPRPRLGWADRRSRAACVNALTADSSSPQRHVTSEKRASSVYPPVAEPVERILDPVLLDAQAASRSDLRRDRGVHCRSESGATSMCRSPAVIRTSLLPSIPSMRTSPARTRRCMSDRAGISIVKARMRGRPLRADGHHAFEHVGDDFDLLHVFSSSVSSARHCTRTRSLAPGAHGIVARRQVQGDDAAFGERLLDRVAVGAGLTERDGAKRQAGYAIKSACHRNLLAARSGQAFQRGAASACLCPIALTHVSTDFSAFPRFLRRSSTRIVHRCETGVTGSPADLLVDQLLVKWRAACLGRFA